MCSENDVNQPLRRLTLESMVNERPCKTNQSRFGVISWITQVSWSARGYSVFLPQIPLVWFFAIKDTRVPLSSTQKKPSVQHTPQFLVLNWGVLLWNWRCAELRGFWGWNEGFWLLRRCGPCVELRGLCGSEGYPKYLNVNSFGSKFDH